MKGNLIILVLVCVTSKLFGQEVSKGYPDSVKNRITKEVNKEAELFRTKLNKDELTTEAVKFSVDTFKIWLTNSKRQYYDFSTEGMNNSVEDITKSYDKLMNIYYNKLLKLLDKNDKLALTSSQKQWLKFRDLEVHFIWIMSDEKYNTGGTIQTNFATGNVFDITKTRTEQIFLYYNSIIEKKELK